MSSWFAFFGRDFLASTLGWSAEERGHYVTLLVAQWEQGGLPDDPKRLELISPGVSKSWKVLEPKFPKSTGGMRRNTRLEHERHLAHQRSERARQSASARWSGKAAAPAPDAEIPPESGGDECSEQCDRISDRICSTDASMTMSYSPPPPPTPPGDFRDDWEALRTAWNAAWGDKRQWRSAEPPQEAIDRLAEPGWLQEAIRAIPEIKRGACAGFRTPPGLRQFCGKDERGTFVARMLGGEFVDSSVSLAKRRTGVFT
jgi:uncharacterized protein YdaU (DUF1376 family)